jgi:hypothetical protein
MPVERRRPNDTATAPAEWKESELHPWVADQIHESQERHVAKIKAKPARDRSKRDLAALAHWRAERKRQFDEAKLSRDEKYRLWLERRPTGQAPMPADNPLVAEAIARARETSPSRDELNEDAALAAYSETLVLRPDGEPLVRTPPGESPTMPVFIEPAMRARRQRLTVTHPYSAYFADPDEDDDE